MNQRKTRRGFTLVELAVGTGLFALGGAALAPIALAPRTDARGATCRMNLMMQGQAYAAYSFTYGGQIASYTWQAGVVYDSEWPTTAGPHSNDLRAVQAQEADLLRRLTGRGPDDPDPILVNWLTSPIHNRGHLPLLEYLGLTPPQIWFACPEDANLLASKADPLDESLWAFAGKYNGYDQFNSEQARQRYPFSSTYQTIPYASVPDSRDDGGPFISPHVQTSHLFTVFHSFRHWGRRNFTEVAFPALKVHIFEHNDFHRSAGDPFYAYEQARCNQLFFDGSVEALRSGDAEPGWDPNNPDDPETFYYKYTPLSTEPIPLGDPDTPIPVRYRFTRDGLGGFDYLSRTRFDEAPDPVRR